MESSGIAESTNQKKRTTWTKPAISCLLNFLINNKEELDYLKKIKQLLDKVPKYSKMDYIIKRINELENKL